MKNKSHDRYVAHIAVILCRNRTAVLLVKILQIFTSKTAVPLLKKSTKKPAAKRAGKIDTIVLRRPGCHSADKHLRPYGFASLPFGRFALSADHSIVIYIITTFIFSYFKSPAFSCKFRILIISSLDTELTLFII